MALWVCSSCTTKYSVGAPRCPQCGGTDHEEDGAAEARAAAPRSGDPKSVWVEYAVAQGVDPEEAAGLTKAELMDRLAAKDGEG